MNERIHVLRESIVKLTQMLAGKSVSVTQRGVTAYVKADARGVPILVNLPYMPDNATDELINAIQGFLDHEVAHILFTDFNVMGSSGSLHSRLNLIEDTRIERKMAERFRGSATNLANTGKFFLDKYVQPELTKALKAGNTDGAIAVLMVPLIRAMSGQHVFAEFMKAHEELMKPVMDKINDMTSAIANAESTADCLVLAKELEQRLRPKAKPSPAPAPKSEPSKSASTSAPTPMPEPDEKDDEETTPPPEPHDEDETVPTAAPESDDELAATEPAPEDEPAVESEPAAVEEESENDEESAGSSGAVTSGAGSDEDEEGGSGETRTEDTDAETTDSTAERAGEMKDSDRSGTPDLSPSLFGAIDKESARGYDDTVSASISASAAKSAQESDYIIYTTDKDVVEPLHVGKAYEASMLVKVQTAVDHMVGPLQKDLERAISARSMSVWSAGHRSGRLHSANLSRLVVGDDRVFRRKHEATSKDVAVELVIDASGSMSGSKIAIATQSAYALASVLERIGISCEVICFTTGDIVADYDELRKEAAKTGIKYSRVESIYMPILKAFNERMTTDVKERFGWLPHSRILANNIDGESIEIAARRLLKRRESGKVMMVLSDGAPAAGGGRGLNKHLERAVDKITKAGVNVIGIGIQSSEVRKFYPKSMVLENVADLPGAVMKELRALILK